MKIPWVKYPWSKTERGQGFFVPCLNVHAIRAEGLRAAMPLRIKAQAEIGTRRGMLGVWFTRLR